jgi:hypothetical protein
LEYDTSGISQRKITAVSKRLEATMGQRWLYYKYLLISFLIFVILNGCCWGQQSSNLTSSKAHTINSLFEPGLLSFYKYAFYRHLNQMASVEGMLEEGEPGKPVATINHTFSGNIFDSKKEKGVGVLLTGYLKMGTVGKYRFQAMSNDGVEVTVGENVVAFDPTVHSDRLSPIEEVTVTTPNWYPITVKYFQRKGSARLELFWQPPGTAGFEIIPASAYGHVKAVER